MPSKPLSNKFQPWSVMSIHAILPRLSCTGGFLPCSPIVASQPFLSFEGGGCQLPKTQGTDDVHPVRHIGFLMEDWRFAFSRFFPSSDMCCKTTSVILAACVTHSSMLIIGESLFSVVGGSPWFGNWLLLVAATSLNLSGGRSSSVKDYLSVRHPVLWLDSRLVISSYHQVNQNVAANCISSVTIIHSLCINIFLKYVWKHISFICS